MSAESEKKTSLEFDYNDLVSLPYRLRYSWILDRYIGDALEIYDRIGMLGSAHLIVPPNVAAVLLMSRGNNQHVSKPLGPGRYHIHSLLGRHVLDWPFGPKWWPVSVQYVSLAEHPFVETLKAPTRDQLNLEISLWLKVRVNHPERVTEVHNLRDHLRNTLQHELVRTLRNRRHEEAVTNLPEIIRLEVSYSQALVEAFARYGLQIEVGLAGFKPDPDWDGLQRRAGTVDKDNEVRRREAQREEDVFAIQQPGLRRKIYGDISTQLREKNQQARIEAIKTVKDLAEALVEDLRRHPGRVYTEKDIQPLIRALDLLDKLAQPVAAPPIPGHVRSYFAVDRDQPYPPPEYLPSDLPVPPGSVWDPNRSTGQSQPPPPSGTSPQSPGPAAPATDPIPRAGEKQ